MPIWGYDLWHTFWPTSLCQNTLRSNYFVYGAYLWNPFGDLTHIAHTHYLLLTWKYWCLFYIGSFVGLIKNHHCLSSPKRVFLFLVTCGQLWHWPLATSPNAKIFAMWRKICDVFGHSGENKNEMLPQYLWIFIRFRGKNCEKNTTISLPSFFSDINMASIDF